MRIQILHTFFYPDKSSVAQLVSDVAFALAADGNEVEVIAAAGHYDGQGPPLPHRETIGGVDICRVWSPNLGKKNLLARGADIASYSLGSVRHALFTRRPDRLVLLTHPPFLPALGSLVGRLRGVPYVVIVMDLYPHIAIRSGLLSERGVPARVAHDLTKRALQGAERVVVLGRCMAGEIAALGVSRDRIAIVPNWVDEDAIRPIPRRENRLRQDLGLGDTFVVMYSGNMGVGHSFDEILAAAERLRHRRDVRFVFIGGGVRRREIAEARERRGLENLLLLDYVPREALAHSLPLGDAHFVSLRPGFEGLMVPSKTYGVMAAGRPVLYQGSPDGEIALMLREAGGGVVVPPGDAAGLTNVISGWADDLETAEACGRRGREVLEATYSRTMAIDRYRQIIGRN